MLILERRVEGDIRYFLGHPQAMIGSDGNAISPTGSQSNKQIHPRFYATYPRILGRYVREQSLMSLETAVQKMSGLCGTAIPHWMEGLFEGLDEKGALLLKTKEGERKIAAGDVFFPTA